MRQIDFGSTLQILRSPFIRLLVQSTPSYGMAANNLRFLSIFRASEAPFLNTIKYIIVFHRESRALLESVR